MMKMPRKLTAILLCVTMIFAMLSVSSYAEDENPYENPILSDCVDGNCDNCPLVILPGINHSPTYLCDENDEPVMNLNGEPVKGTLFMFDFSVKDIFTKFVPLAFHLVKTLITQRDGGFTDSVYNLACSAFHVQACNPDGTTKNNLITERNNYSLADATPEYRDWAYSMIPMQQLTQKIGEDHVFWFTFNLVGNPITACEELHEYIQLVKEQTGHDKVNLLNVSLGGTIFTAYIDLYGWDDINEVVNAVAAMDGTDVFGDFYERVFNLDDEFLYQEYFEMIFNEEKKSTTGANIVNSLLHLLPRQVFRDTLTRAMDGLHDTFLINCPQLWACVPCDRYEALAAKHISDSEHAKLKANTDRYHQAQINLTRNVKQMKADGVEVNSISGANLAFGAERYSYFAIMGSAKTINGDGIIQLSSTSIGAIGAPNGTVLPTGHTQSATYALDSSYSYISPDRTVDASTCALPDNTWFFLGQHHEIGYNQIALNLACELLTNPELVDVHSMPEIWPQFNGNAFTRTIKNFLNKEVLSVDRNSLNDADRQEFDAAVTEAQDIFNGTIADREKAEAATKRLEAILIKIGARTAPVVDEEALAKEAKTAEISDKIFEVYGSNGFSDGPRIPLKEAIRILFS